MLNSKYTEQDLVTAEEQQQLVHSSSLPSNLFSSNQHHHEQTFTQQHEANTLLSDDDDEEEENPNKNHSQNHLSDEENKNINSMTISEAALTGDTYTRIKMPFKTKIAQNVMQTTIATLGLILFYFALSIGLTFYQRWLLNVCGDIC